MQRPSKISRRTSRPGLQDKRFVKQVMFSQYAPPHWVAMDIMDSDCLLVEIAEKKKMDARFLDSCLELLAVYSVQNPFLWGQFLLRSDQMKQQAEDTSITVMEKQYFHPVDSEYLETIARHGFDPRFDQLLFNQVPQAGVAFYSSPGAANVSLPSSSSTPLVRYMFQARVMVGSVVKRPGGVATSAPINKKIELPVDTVTDTSHTVFRKYKVSETYPEYLLVYKEAGKEKVVVEEKLPMKHAKVIYLPGKTYSRNNSRKPANVDLITAVRDSDQPLEKHEEEAKKFQCETIKDIVQLANVVIHREEEAVDK